MTECVEIEVSCALIVKDERLLATRRSEGMPHALKWEFPGGKLKEGESPVDSIIREIREELGIGISVHKALLPVSHDYPSHRIRLYPFICEVDEGSISLAEHQECLWVEYSKLDGLDWLEADLKVLEEFRKYNGA